jgi:hypothetical protein
MDEPIGRAADRLEEERERWPQLTSDLVLRDEDSNEERLIHLPPKPRRCFFVCAVRVRDERQCCLEVLLDDLEPELSATPGPKLNERARLLEAHYGDMPERAFELLASIPLR